MKKIKTCDMRAAQRKETAPSCSFTKLQLIRDQLFKVSCLFVSNLSFPSQLRYSHSQGPICLTHLYTSACKGWVQVFTWNNKTSSNELKEMLLRGFICICVCVCVCRCLHCGNIRLFTQCCKWQLFIPVFWIRGCRLWESVPEEAGWEARCTSDSRSK